MKQAKQQLLSIFSSFASYCSGGELVTVEHENPDIAEVSQVFSRYRVEIESTIKFVEQSHNINHVDCLWLGTVISLLVFLPISFRHAETSLAKLVLDLERYCDRESWNADSKGENGFTYRGMLALRDLLQALGSLTGDQVNQDLMAVWSTIIEEQFILDEFVPVCKRMKPLWNRLEDGIRNSTKEAPFTKKCETLSRIRISLPFMPQEDLETQSEIKSVPSSRIKAQPIPASHYRPPRMGEFKDNKTSVITSWVQDQQEIAQAETGAAAWSAIAKTQQALVTRPRKPNISKVAPVKMSAAAILREEATLKKRLAEEKRILEQEMITSYTDVDAETNRLLAHQQEEEEQRIHQAKLKLIVQLAREQAQFGRRKVAEDKNKVVAQVKEESKKLLAEKELEYYQADIKTQEQVSKILETRQRASQAVETAKTQKLLMAREMSESMQSQIRSMKEREVQEREALMAKIREMKTSVSFERQPKFKDEAHSEMSISELKETLKSLKQAQLEEVADRKKKIQESRVAYSNDLREKAKFLEAYRSELKQAKNRTASDTMSVKTKMTTASLLESRDLEKLQRKLETLKMQNRN